MEIDKDKVFKIIIHAILMIMIIFVFAAIGIKIKNDIEYGKRKA